MVIIIPALAVAAVIYAWSVEEVGVLVDVEDSAANRRPSGAKRECLAFQTPPVPLAIRLAVARVLDWDEWAVQGANHDLIFIGTVGLGASLWKQA